ncbi:MAG: hypothetical protein JNM39_14640 [Bdellovibrionaceae bacterium]|nr:hypothetical protein [Pseudobdellovibrionaceae bacterium]
MELSENLGDKFILVLPWVMTSVFVGGCFVRLIVYFTVQRHEWFAREFEKRVGRYMDHETPGKVKNVSFFVLAKRMLERTYYESFEIRDRLKRRRNDPVMGWSDRIFLVKQGCAWLVKDILKQLKFVKWAEGNPKLLNITKATFQHNPCFNRIFGVFQIGAVNDIVSIMPGLFVVAGILGTFIGIAKGLPELAGMSMSDLDNTKLVMDKFLNEIAFAMRSSIYGIAFSLLMHFWNTIFSPDRVYASMIDRFESSLDLLWYRSDNNDYPSQERAFDEHKDPVEALAEASIKAETQRNPKGRDEDTIRKEKAS